MHTCPTKNHPNDRCPVCDVIPRLMAGLQESNAKLEATEARLKVAEAKLESRKRPAALSKALGNAKRMAFEAGGALRTAVWHVARSGLVAGGVALRDVGDAMVRASVAVPVELLEPDNIVDDIQDVAEPIGDEIAEAETVLEEARLALLD